MLLDMQIYMPSQGPLAQPDIAFTPRQIKKWIKALSMINFDVARKQTYQLLSKEGAKISLAELLPSTERSGVSSMLDRWVVSSALKRLSEHTAKSPNSLFFIKLTTGALNDKQFATWLELQCKDFNIDPFRLVFDMRE